MKYALAGIIAIIVTFVAGSYVYHPSPPHQVQGIQQVVANLSPSQFQSALATGKYILLDVRSTEEYAAGYIEGAQQIDFNQASAFSSFLDTLDKNASYLVYCRTGRRSATALQVMQQEGFTHIADLAGGYTAWLEAGLPVAVSPSPDNTI